MGIPHNNLRAPNRRPHIWAVSSNTLEQFPIEDPLMYTPKRRATCPRNTPCRPRSVSAGGAATSPRASTATCQSPASRDARARALSATADRPKTGHRATPKTAPDQPEIDPKLRIQPQPNPSESTCGDTEHTHTHTHCLCIKLYITRQRPREKPHPRRQRSAM